MQSWRSSSGPMKRPGKSARIKERLLDATTIDADGQPATAVGPSGLVLNTTAPIERDTELVIRLRINPPQGQGSGLTIFPGQKKPGELAAIRCFCNCTSIPHPSRKP